MADIYSIINAAAQRHGVAPETLLAIAQIESRMNPNADNPNSSASGLFQFTSATARDYGLTGAKRNDAAAQADAAARMAATNARSLQRVLGRAPTTGELYLAHQQGLGGATALLRNPNVPAAQVLAQYHGTNASNVIRQNGGNPNMTAGQFAGIWVNKGNSVAGRIPPGEMPQVATALDVINRVAPTPATPSSAMGYARANTPAGMPIAPLPTPRPDHQRQAPVPATPSLPMQSIRAANAASNPQLQSSLESYVSRQQAPKTEIYTGPSVPISLMALANEPNSATPRLQSDGSVRSPMSMPPMPASVEQRVTARYNPPPMPPTPRSPPPRNYGESNLIADSFAALPPAPAGLQSALNNYAGNGIGTSTSFADLQNFAGTNIPDRLTAGTAEMPVPQGPPTQVAQVPPLPRVRPQTGIGGPLPPIAPPMPPVVQPVAPVIPAAPKVAPVPAPRLQRPGIFGTPKIGNWNVPLPGVLGHVQNFTAAMNNAGGPFNNGADNLLYNAMRGGNFASPGGGTAQSAGFRYSRSPSGGWVNVGAVNPSLTPAQRYEQASSRNRSESSGSAARDSDYWDQATGGNSGRY